MIILKNNIVILFLILFYTKKRYFKNKPDEKNIIGCIIKWQKDFDTELNKVTPFE